MRGHFVDQGWFPTQEAVNEKRWIFDGDLFDKSFIHVAEQAPNADAYLINGMCNFRSGPGGLQQRPVHLARDMEVKLGKPVIGHDTALYWRIMTDPRSHQQHKALGVCEDLPFGPFPGQPQLRSNG